MIAFMATLSTLPLASGDMEFNHQLEYWPPYDGPTWEAVMEGVRRDAREVGRSKNERPFMSSASPVPWPTFLSAEGSR